MQQAPGYFGSDNMAAIHPQILEAIARANAGHAGAYGHDALTAEVESRFREVFETDCRVFLVGTGTAANVLALSACCPPYGAILCHEEAHVHVDECTAPELFTGGARLLGVEGAHGKPDLDAMRSKIHHVMLNGVHGVRPHALSLTNATEAGTAHDPDELSRYAELCREHSLRLHVDGARFANVVAHFDKSPAELSWKAGVDIMSFGATKNGAMAAEAVVIFNKALADGFDYRRKRGAQLWSKHRYLAAQFAGYFENDLWLQLATHANTMAQRLAVGLCDIAGVAIPALVQANEVFPCLPLEIISGLQADGFVFYEWPLEPGMIRLVTSYQTSADEVDAFIERCRDHARGV